MEQPIPLKSPSNKYHQQNNHMLPPTRSSTERSSSDVVTGMGIESRAGWPRADTDYESVPAENIEVLPSTSALLRLDIEEESHDVSRQRIKHSSSAAHLFSASWTKEFLSWLLALAFFGALVGVLAAFNARSVPHWKYGITLGAIASLFATLTSWCLMLPLTAALGQLKWMWFERERPISDFETLEKAGQGPQGSLVLLGKGKGGFIASVGAIMIILQLAIGPFVQQIIQTRDMSVNATTASIPIAVNYSVSTSALINIDLSMRAAVMNAALDVNAPSTDFNVSPVCSTGNCTWPPYQSLAFCSTCTDITGQLTAGVIKNGNVPREGHNWTLPNGLFLVVEDFRSSLGLISMTMNNTMENDLESIVTSKNESLNAVLDVFVIVGNSNYTENKQVGPFAAECLLQICIQSYNAQETNAIFQETIVRNPDVLSHQGGYPYASGNFSYDAYAARNLQMYLGETFIGAASQYDSLSGTDVFPRDIEQAMFQALNNSSPHTLTSVFSNIAKSMTRSLRTSTTTASSLSLPVTSKVMGETASLITVVSIEWYWICLPAILVAAGLVFLLAVIWQTKSRDFPLLKDSTLATLFYGLGDEVLREFRSDESRMKIGRAAAKLRIRFRNDKEGWSLKSG